MIIRLTVLILLALQWLYWFIKSKEAEKKKPKTQFTSFKIIIEKFFGIVGNTVVTFQLIGMKIYPFSSNTLIHYFGFFLVLVGITLAITARKQLDSNWTHAYDYQIKREHTLVTDGIYQYIRHPIYSGIIFTSLGVQLIVQSYLFFFALLALPWCYYWGKREEKILSTHFGMEYKNYMKKTKMFIPYIF